MVSVIYSFSSFLIKKALKTIPIPIAKGIAPMNAILKPERK